MSQLYQFILILIVILFFTGCTGTDPIKETTRTSGKSIVSGTTEGIDSSAMSAAEKIHYAENFFQQALSPKLSKKLADKNILLSNSLTLCSEVLMSYHTLTAHRTKKTPEITPAQQEYTAQLVRKIMAQMDFTVLNHEQKNQFLLASAALKLANYQAETALELLNQDFNTNSSKKWSMYHRLRAGAQFQLGQMSVATQELIIRHGYLSTEQEKQQNLNLIWKYLAKLDLANIPKKSGASKIEHTYTGWLELAKIFRETHDPQIVNHYTNFWLQNYPGHQADRTFILQIIQARRESILHIKNIAVLLPLQGKLAKPAKAIQDGIMASHYKSPLADNIQLSFYDTSSDDPIWHIYQQAINEGADFIIGPLAKSNVRALSESIQPVPTLVLNSLENNTAPVAKNNANNLFQFGLSPEADARMVAEKGRQDGHYYAAVMAPDNQWGKRMTTAFSEHWKKSGGKIVELIEYQSQVHDFSDSIKAMLHIDQSESRKQQVSNTIGRKVEFTPRRRQDIDMLFMASFPRQAKQIPLQVIYHHGETIPIYATEHIVADYHNARQNIDMDGVKFSDMPFLLGITQNTASQQNTYQNTLYQRLFAMGVDSYQLAPYVNYLLENPSESFAGDTGQITINPDGHILRSLPWATFEQGELILESSNHNTDNAAIY